MLFPELTDIEAGDIVFFMKSLEKTENGEFEEAIVTVAAQPIAHVGILSGTVGHWSLIHAVPESGVCEQPLTDVMQKIRPSGVEVRGVQLPVTTRTTAYQWAKSKIGAKYNDIFSDEMLNSTGNEAFYCSQLIVKSYEFAGIADFSPQHQLNFTGPDGRILPYWENYFKKLELPVPQGAPGSHPATLIQSKYLKTNFARTCHYSMAKFVVPATIDSALHFLNGARVALKSLKQFEVIQPRNGKVLVHCAAASTETVDEAIKDARQAQPSWAALSAQQRGAVLRKAAAIIRDCSEKLAYWETVDCGKPIEESRWDMASCADCFEFFGGAAHNLAGNHFPLGNNNYAYTERIPWGVVGAIGVWNYPLQTASWKIAPALMCGNAVVYKPSPLAPGEGDTGKAICEHSGVDKITFTGSTETGTKILASCSLPGRLKPVTLELGGKSSVIVFKDADIDIAVTGALMANFFSQGEVCSNASKVLVHQSIYDEFQRKIVDLTKGLIPNDPLLDGTKIGATISKAHLSKVKAFIDGACREGAILLCGGEEVIVNGLEGGYYLSPAVLTNITENMRIYQEEVFGAVMLLIPFQQNEVIFYTRVDKNSQNSMIPFGGMKQSGFGRENGVAALEAFSQIKSVFVNAANKLNNPFL
ncbi:unnamed protein product [Gongylonema pulchrum]|uniref:Aldedh domain-containing protein n=1 Tax=Gongylonema pulchrum TaxID=637853 RepID=A0A183DPA1_9BILA|nr:unnamed protein product [Gongylonema pulchrum]